MLLFGEGQFCCEDYGQICNSHAVTVRRREDQQEVPRDKREATERHKNAENLGKIARSKDQVSAENPAHAVEHREHRTAVSNVLTLEDPHRFRKSRDAGCFVGLQPGRRNSGESEPQMRISKEGGRVSTDHAGARGALHFGAFWGRQ
jgi:hypothetical protein